LIEEAEMGDQSKPTPEQALAMIFQSMQLLADSFWQMSAKLDALKATVCELHPEVAIQLEERIRNSQNEASTQFAELQRTIEFLRTKFSGPIQ
jgi:hypothetical protein